MNDKLDGTLNEEQQEKSLKNIGSQWLQSLFSSIETITSYERVARDGCEGLMEYVQNPTYISQNSVAIRLKALSLIIGELKIALPKAKRFLMNEEYKRLTNEIEKWDISYSNNLVEDKNQKPLKVFQTCGDYKKKKNWLKLEPGFKTLFDKVVNVKKELLDGLDDILFPKGKEIKQGES